MAGVKGCEVGDSNEGGEDTDGSGLLAFSSTVGASSASMDAMARCRGSTRDASPFTHVGGGRGGGGATEAGWTRAHRQWL